jgi:LemA protein
MTVAIIGAAALALVIVAFVVSYNRFVDERQTITSSWSNVDTELQRRHDLIPNLVETVRGYATHEHATFDAVLHARARALAAGSSPAGSSPADASGIENRVVAGIRQVLALSEAYPDLRANVQFLDLQQQLVTTENRIQAARRVFNGNVRDYNRRIESIPSNLVAALMRLPRAEYFEVDPLMRTAGAPAARF